MLYYSEVTKKAYKTEKECAAAENEVLAAQEKEKKEKERLAAERKARAAEVEKARQAMLAAQSKYKEVLEAFCKSYGSYHYTSTDASTIPTLFDFFNIF